MHCITGPLFLCILAVFPAVLTTTLEKTYLIAGPNAIRVGVDETILVNILGEIDEDETIPVTITLKDYPRATTIYNTTTINVSKRHPEIAHVRVRPEDVTYTTGAPQYVDLHAVSTHPSFSFADNTPVFLSFKAGHVFIQTDKPIYTPKDTAGVYIRLIAVDEQMLPSPNKVRLDIMTPHGRIIERYDDISPEDGFLSETFNLPPNPVLGNWSVVAFYGHEYKHNSIVQFLVKEYVLPKFYVTIELGVDGHNDRTYILSDNIDISTVVKGMYVFKKPVYGACRIVYHLMDPDGATHAVEEVNSQLTEHGECSHTIKIQELIGSTDFDDNIDRRLHVEAFVMNSVSGKIESSTNTTLKFVDSPFEIIADKTFEYFKTGFAFDVKIDLIDHNGNPVPNTNIQITVSGDWDRSEQTRTTDANGFVAFRLNIPEQNSINSMTINAATVAEGHLLNHQRIKNFTISKYITNGDNGLLVQPLTSAASVVKISENGLGVTLQITNDQSENVQQVFLFVVAGGKIVEHRTSGNIIEGTTLTIPITHEMVPSARLVSFFVSNDNKLEADSLWIDVEDICKNNIEISIPLNDGKTYYEPGTSVTVNVKAKPHTRIKMLGVDSAVYLLQDYHRLTKKKMFSRMAGYDLGCGPGRGRDVANVFKNAGVVILTNSVYNSNGEQRREGYGCEEGSSRGKRSNEETLQELMQLYESNSRLSEYCRKGSTFSSHRSCAQRVQSLMRIEGLTEGDDEIDAFQKCCMAASHASGRSGLLSPVNVNFASSDIVQRTHFPESWMYEDVDILMGDSEETSKQFQLPHSITTWIVEAVGVSPIHGMCVADNKHIVVRSDVFLDVTLPYTVKRFEQVAIVATVYNYRKGLQGNGELQAQLWMPDVEGLCCSVEMTEHGAYARGSVTVPYNSAKSYTFIVVPLETGEFPINVYMFSRPREELVTKTLRVDPEGVLNRVSRSVLLNPAGADTDHLELPKQADDNVQITETVQSADFIQSDFITVKMPNDAIQESTSCQLSVIGGLMGPVANASIQGLKVETLLRMPSGCPEQTLSSTAPNVYLYKYVKSVNQDTAGIEGESFKHMKEGLARMHNQNYIKPDGSYNNNVWLTAYALKIYCKATEFVQAVDETFICDGIHWLTTKQQSDGSFSRHLPWTTAYVISAIFDCSCKTINLKPHLDDASSFLETQLPAISTDHRVLPIVTYALSLMNSTQKDIANNHLRGIIENDQYGGKFVSDPSPSQQIEITAYALLAQITLGDLDYGFSLVKWLTQNRNDMGAWYSTRDTIVGLEALSEYALATQQEETNLQCTVTAEEPLADWNIEPTNLLVLRAAQTPIGETVVVKTQGVGLATLSVNLTYNTAAKTEDDLCSFEVNVTTVELPSLEVESPIENEEESIRLEIEVCARYLDGENTDMAIIDVGLMSGFTPIEDTLDEARNITLIDIVSTADQAVIFYAEKIPGGDIPLCVSFEAEQKPKVRNVQPAPVKVYDYYNPEISCLKFYSADTANLLTTLLDDNMRICVAAPCYNEPHRDWDTMNQATVPATARQKVCAGTEYYAYDVVVLQKNTESDSIYDIYTMDVTFLRSHSSGTASLG